MPATATPPHNAPAYSAPIMSLLTSPRPSAGVVRLYRWDAERMHRCGNERHRVLRDTPEQCGCNPMQNWQPCEIAPGYPRAFSVCKGLPAGCVNTWPEGLTCCEL